MLLSSLTIQAQAWKSDNLQIYNTYEDIAPLLESDNDTTYVFNFWATWCGPCVKELPYYEALHDKYVVEKEGKLIKVILVSLDFEKQIERKLIPFLNKEKINSEVVLLLDPKPHRWIDKVHPEWSGAIPITLIRKGQKTAFYEKVFHSLEELETKVLPFLSH